MGITGNQGALIPLILPAAGVRDAVAVKHKLAGIWRQDTVIKSKSGLGGGAAYIAGPARWKAKSNACASPRR